METEQSVYRVSCILRYLGRGRGPGTVSIIVSGRVAAPFLPFGLPSRTRRILFMEEITNRSTNSIHPPLLIQGIEKKWQLLSLMATVCLSGPDGRGTMRGIKGNGVMGVGIFGETEPWPGFTLTCKKCMLIRGGWRARTETRISRNCLRGEIFHSNLFSHAPDVVLWWMFLRKLIIFDKKKIRINYQAKYKILHRNFLRLSFESEIKSSIQIKFFSSEQKPMSNFVINRTKSLLPFFFSIPSNDKCTVEINDAKGRNAVCSRTAGNLNVNSSCVACCHGSRKGICIPSRKVRMKARGCFCWERATPWGRFLRYP